jgi:hypothetical protein
VDTPPPRGVCGRPLVAIDGAELSRPAYGVAVWRPVPRLRPMHQERGPCRPPHVVSPGSQIQPTNNESEGPQVNHAPIIQDGPSRPGSSARWALLGVAVLLLAPVACLVCLWGALLGGRAGHWLLGATLVGWLALVAILITHRRRARASAWRGQLETSSHHHL